MSVKEKKEKIEKRYVPQHCRHFISFDSDENILRLFLDVLCQEEAVPASACIPKWARNPAISNQCYSSYLSTLKRTRFVLSTFMLQRRILLKVTYYSLKTAK